MSFWQKFKEGFRRFMAGRYGADALSQGIIIAGLVLFLLAVFTRIGLFSLPVSYTHLTLPTICSV